MNSYMKKFEQDDIFYTRYKFYPKNSFFLYEGIRYWNNEPNLSGVLTNQVGLVPGGFLSLYEMNIDRASSLDTYNSDSDSGNKHLIRPFTQKTNNAYVSTFKRIDSSSFFSKKVFQDSSGMPIIPVLTGSYPMSSSISVDYYPANSVRTNKEIRSLKNILNEYTRLSPHFAYSSSFLGVNDRNFEDCELNLINVPEIFYGSQIKKGSVSLSFYISGTLLAQAHDIARNGELRQTLPVGSNGSGSIVGVVLYNEGIIILTSSVVLNSLHTEDYDGVGGSALNPKWVYWGSSISGSSPATTPSSSYFFEFNGTEKKPVLNLLARAKRGEYNHSNNLTSIRSGSILPSVVTKQQYIEPEGRSIGNIVSSSFNEVTGSFQKTTYISEINLYDENKNLVGIAKLAKPFRKTENREINFRLKYDL